MPNLTLDAGPGTGKTTTLIALAKILPMDRRTVRLDEETLGFTPTEEQTEIFEWALGMYPRTDSLGIYAFNTNIRDDIKSKAPKNIDVKTIHGLGYSILQKKFGRLTYEGSKWTDVVEQATGEPYYQLPMDTRKMWTFAKNLFFMVREQRLDPASETDILDVYNTFNIDHAEDIELSRTVVEMVGELAFYYLRITKEIDFSDMLCMNFEHDTLKEPIKEVGLVDETQDLSPARLDLVLKACRNLIFCGDPQQAIYHFAGADTKAFERVKEASQYTLPLKVCFRCPTKVIEIANKIRPEIVHPLTSPQGMIEGHVENISYDELPAKCKFQPHTNMILSRTNAPIFSLAMRFTKDGIPCRILGNDIGEKLIKAIKEYDCVYCEDLVDKVEAITVFKCEQEQEKSKPNVGKLMLWEDEAMCIAALASEFVMTKDLIRQITLLFNPQTTGSAIKLATIHKAKGLECDKIYILNECPIPHPAVKTQEDYQQEINLLFVATTRAKKSLYYVRKREMEVTDDQTQNREEIYG